MATKTANKINTAKAAKKVDEYANKAVKYVKDGNFEKKANQVAKYVKDGNIQRKAKQYTSQAGSNPKTYLILGGVVLGGFLLYKLNGGFNAAGNAISEARENQIGTTDPKMDKTKAASTLNDAQAKQRAESLFAAMNYGGGTDEQRIYDALRGVTYNDWVKIKEAFGERRYNSLVGEASFFPFPLANLAEWINAELSNDELKKLVKIAPEVFK